MADQITNYKCPACTGPLHFSGASGKLECDYCGSSYSVEEIEALYEKKDEQAAQAAAEAEQKAAQQPDEGEWAQPEGADWAEPGMKSYSCPSCGAELICDETTAATSCPYCGNTTIVPGQLSGARKPDYIIPFKLSKEDAVAALKNHYKKKPLLPKVFSAQNHIEKIQGVYVPFWLFNGSADADIRYKEAYIEAKKEDIEIVKSPVGMPGRAIHNAFLDKAAKGELSKGKCHQCLAKCDPAQIPYCITDALVNAAKGNTEEGLLFCGANAFQAKSLEHVSDIMKEFEEEFSCLQG